MTRRPPIISPGDSAAVSLTALTSDLDRVTGTPMVGTAPAASKGVTTPSFDRRAQVTYDGHPLYLFQGHEHPGDTTGQRVNAFGADWYVLSLRTFEIIGGSSGRGY